MNKKKIPRFKNEQEEKSFWLQNDSTDFIDWSKASRVNFPNLEKSKNKSKQC